MKTKIILIIILNLTFCNILFTQAYSNITYDAGSSIDIGIGADVCATNIYINGTFTGSGTICTGALPVTLISFESRVDKRDIKLIWVTENEINNAGFDIERKRVDLNSADQWKKISFIQGNGNTSGQRIYSFDDNKLQSAVYKYRLKQIDFNGNYEYFELANDIVVNTPGKFDMRQNYPNPSNPRSKIDYEMPISGKITIKLYNMLGQEVFDIVNETKDAGYYSAEFDGSNLSSGVYFYRIAAEGNRQSFTKTLKLILVK